MAADWINVAQNKDQSRAFMNMVLNLQAANKRKRTLDWLSNY
jgi:hypothetical protein